MSSEDHSAFSSSTVGNDNASAKGNQLAALGRPFIEQVKTDESIVSRSVSWSRGNHSSSPSVRRNCNAPAERVAWRRIPSNEVRPPNRNIGRLNVMPPHMKFRQPNLQAYGTAPPPVFPMPFIGNPEPSTCSSAQGLNVFSYAPNDAYYHPTHPYVGYFIPIQDIYAAQHTKIFNWLHNMRSRLLKQIEYYFSSGNLETDIFLKRQMDANGWAPINLIAGFRRVKALMKEAQLLYNYLRSLNFMPDNIAPLRTTEQYISDSLRFSDHVEVQGDKIRKRHEWEKWVLPQNPTESNAESADQFQMTPN